MEKIVGWVQRFKETGDAAVQYDPAHAALPWAAFRFLLQTTVSEVQVFSAVAGDLEEVARNLTRYRIFERLHLRGPQSELQAEIERALIHLYAEILRQLSYAVKFFSERTITRVLKSPFRTVKEDRKKQLQAREHDVNQLATLADTDILRNLNATFERMSVQSTKALSEDKFNEIVAWLSVAPYHSHHQFVAESRLAGVGQWLLNHDDYLQWLTSSSPSLCYLHGIPGSGKSTLCSVVVDSMMAQSGSNPSATPLGYFYCANPEFEKARRSCDDVLRTILFQLSINPSSKTTVKQFLCSEYERQVARSPAGKLDIMKLRTKDCVRLILELAEQDPIIIIIDGLDSVEEDDRHTLTKALGDIVSQADNVAKVFVTSRTSNRAAMIPTSAFQIQISPELARPDMKIFVKNQIDTAVKAKLLLGGQISLETREALENALLEGAGEMFLWVKLHVKQICHETIEDDVVSALRKSLPESIDQLYQKSIDSIFETGYKAREVAMKALSWVLYMREPLTPQALLATVESGSESNVNATQLMSICHDLVILDAHCNVVRFSHQSVQDFLQGHERFAPSSAHTLLASLCLEACSHGPASEEAPSIPSDDFYVYAAMYWPVHCKMAHDLSTVRPSVGDSNLTKTVISFMFDEDWVTTLSFESWIETLGVIIPSLQISHELVPALSAIFDSHSGFLFTLSTFGLESVLGIALSNIDSVDINQRSHHGYTPLYLASTFGHLNTVTILASHGAELNVECGKFGSPLHTACFNGCIQVVLKLLELGANIACGSTFQTALEAAIRGGQEDVALQLVKCHSMITTEEQYEKAMEGAAFVGFVKVVQVLEGSEFKLFRRDNDNTIKKRFRKAIEGGQLGVIRKLLRQSTGNHCLVPPDAIAIATLHNHKDLVKFFLDEGLDVEVEGSFGTPLRTAALLDYRPLLCLLLERGANINSCGSFGDAIQAASIKGHNDIIRLLIQEGAIVNQRTGFYGSALQAAAYHGQLETVGLLLDDTADIHQFGIQNDAIHAAAASGHDQVIQLMLQKGCQYYSWLFAEPRLLRRPCTEESHGRRERQNLKSHGRPSQYCDFRRSEKPLVDFAVILGEENGGLQELHSTRQQLSQVRDEAASKRYPLEAAACAGHTRMVRFLLQQKDIVGIPGEEIKYAIEAAAEAGHFSIIEDIKEVIKTQKK
ncbi:Ankyrin repeat domain-containing protein 50 [Colletotrichum siamense]|nr:Ankyrin repeat domain-containing protein 50 [Colletotrichum siamense]